MRRRVLPNESADFWHRLANERAEKLTAAQAVIEKQREALLKAETALAIAAGVIEKPIKYGKVLAVVNDALRLTEDET